MLHIHIENFISTLELIQNWHNLDHGHGERTAILSVKIGRRLSMNEDELKLLEYAARIHDLGRLGIDDHIISKPGELTQSQRAAMQEHSQLGYDVLQKSGLPKEIIEAVLYHHEHWDGSGYPKRLKGLNIPLFARIILITDTYDGIISERPYHRSSVIEVVLDEMNKSIMWFDPKLFATFLSVLRDVK